IIINGNNNVDVGFAIDGEECGIRSLYIKNFNDYGIFISKSPSLAYVEGCAVNENGTGIYTAADYTLIYNNYIGLNPANGAAEGNANYGIEIDGFATAEVSLGEDGANIICDNGNSGLYAHGKVDLVAHNNYFGTRENRDIYRPNGHSSGFGSGAWIDVTTDSEGEFENNVFHYNAPHGIRTGSSTNNYTIISNEFYSQEAYGIWMEGGTDGYINSEKKISQNIFSCNIEGGIRRLPDANENVAAPKILSVSTTEIIGTADPKALIEVYVDKSTCVSCQGERYIGNTEPDAQGKWSISVQASVGDVVSTTATLYGSTSEFSACKTIVINNDEPCVNDITALSLPMNFNPCEGQISCASTYDATDSSEQFGQPTETCYGEPTLFTGADIWFSTIVPNTGNLMIRQREGTEIDVMMELYSGNCFSSLKLLDCANFYLSPTHMVIKADNYGLDVGEQIFLRVYDTKLDGDFDEGNVALSAHELPADESKWVFCDEGGGTYPPTEFIVTFKTGIHPDTISDYIKWMEAQGAQLSKQCSCAPNEILLW
ncbi:MAG: hypothetical protein AB8G22_21380, partial [Saprospiraceae bacterium]